MIKLTWLQLAHPSFQQAVGTIWDCPMLDGATSYTAHRIKSRIEKVDKEIRAMRLQICQKYGKKGEDGKLISDERGFITFDTPEDNQKFEAEFQQLFNEKFVEMKVSKLDFQKLVNVRGLTPRQWEFLEPILENLPVDEDDEGPLPEVVEEAPKN